jgi:hypothetical protein
MRRCLYCTIEKDEAEFSDEHVMPQGLGGNLKPTNPFKTDHVCRKCNSICGLYIDRPFIRSLFTQNNRAAEGLRYIKPASNAEVPLSYWGQLELKHGDKICDFWLGPGGDLIYHFHEPYPEEPNVPITTGAPPHLKNIDKGFAFLFIAATNPAWWPTILWSFAQHFKGSDLYLANGATPAGDVFSDIPDDLKELHATLMKNRGVMHRVQFAVSTVYGDRFLAKLALGMGFLFLDPSFATSDSAKFLRDAMWEKDPDVRREMPIHGQGFLGGSIDFAANLLNWPGGHLIFIGRMGDKTFMLARFYDSQQAAIVLSSDPQHFPGQIEDGIVFVFSPGLQAFVGPIKLVDFLVHRQNLGPKNPELAALEERMREAGSSRPPLHINEVKPVPEVPASS